MNNLIRLWRRLFPFTAGETNVLALVGAGHLLSHFYVLALPPLFPLLKGEFDVTYVALGMMVSVNALTTSIAQTPFGFLVDRIGSRRFLVAGLILQGCLIIAIGFTDSYLAALALFGLVGIANAVFHPVDYALLSGSIARERLGQAFSIHTFTGNLGWVFAPVVMLYLTALFDWRVALVIVGCAPFIVAAFVIWQFNAMVEERPADDQGSTAADTSTTREGVALLLSPTILMAFAFFMLIPMSFGAMRVFSVSALVDLYDYSLNFAAVALTGFLIGTSIGILTGGLFVDRVKRPEFMAGLGFVGGAVFVVVIGSISLPYGLVCAAMVAAGFCAGIVQPARDLLVRRVTPEGSAGKVFGFVSTGIGVGGAIMPLVFGFVLDLGDPRWVFWLAGVFFIVALATVGRFGATSKRVWKTSESSSG